LGQLRHSLTMKLELTLVEVATGLVVPAYWLEKIAQNIYPIPG
jgi:hypothetical protein